METITLHDDISVFYVTADSYPQGILASHQKLHSLVPYSEKRRYFGISRPENGPIVYRAAAEELSPGEGKKLGCDTLVLKKGNYLSITIDDYLQKLPEIETTFASLLSQPGLDPNGYCVEWYISEKDLKCMIRLA